MNVRQANKNDIKALYSLWEECFSNDETYLNLFFRQGFPLTSTYILSCYDSVRTQINTDASSATTDSFSSQNILEEIASALSFFTIYLRYQGASYKGAYLYGVCTSTKHRGQKLSVQLLEYSKKELKHQQYDFILAFPAEESLIQFYINQGINTLIPNTYIEISLPDLDPSKDNHTTPLTFRALSSEEIYPLHRVNLQANNNSVKTIIEQDFLNYIIADTLLKEGGVCRGDKNLYYIGYKLSANSFLILETNAQNSDWKSIADDIRSLFNDSGLQILLSTPDSLDAFPPHGYFLAEALHESLQLKQALQKLHYPFNME